jgi:hypothetical protein
MEGYKLQHRLDQSLRQQVMLENERGEVVARLQRHQAQLLKHGLVTLLRMTLMIALGQLLWPGKLTFILFLCAAVAAEFIFIPKYKAPSLWMRLRDIIETRKYLRSLERLIEDSRESHQE